MKLINEDYERNNINIFKIPFYEELNIRQIRRNSAGGFDFDDRVNT